MCIHILVLDFHAKYSTSKLITHLFVILQTIIKWLSSPIAPRYKNDVKTQPISRLPKDIHKICTLVVLVIFDAWNKIIFKGDIYKSTTKFVNLIWIIRHSVNIRYYWSHGNFKNSQNISITPKLFFPKTTLLPIS